MKPIFALIILCVFNFQLKAQVSFRLSSSPVVGSYTYSVVAADVNGDGNEDLVCASLIGALSVLTNNGSGGFALSATYDDNPVSVVAADVNGDGWVDLICANSGANTVTVFTNNGSGDFVLSATYAVGIKPESVTAADVNGDGWVDFICANAGASTLSVLTNNRSGGFTLSGTYAVGNYPVSVVAADVNGDGWADLICANSGEGNGKTLSVLTNNGSGGFVLSSSPVVGQSPVSVVAADVNGDGWSDLICANAGANTLSVLTNNGSGLFVSNATYTVGFGTSSQLNCVIAADVNGDGAVDLICADYGANTIWVLTNNANGGFVIAGNYTVGTGPTSVVAADVNRDGRVDLICSDYGGDTLSVLTNTTSNYGPHTAAATAVLINGFVVAATITDVGYGYTNAPLVQIVGGGGSGAQSAATISNGVVTAITMLSAGSNYTSKPSIVISPPFSLPSLGMASATCLIFTNTAVGGNYQLQVFQSGTWDSLGSSFVAATNNYLQYVDGIGNGSLFRLSMLPVQATAAPQIAYEFVVGATITSCGSGYDFSPAVSIVGGGGSGAQGVATISNGVVTAITILDAGSGYTSAPTIQIGPPSGAVPALLPGSSNACRLDYIGLTMNLIYELQASPNLDVWTNYGPAFTATVATNSQYLNLEMVDEFFRLSHP